MVIDIGTLLHPLPNAFTFMIMHIIDIELLLNNKDDTNKTHTKKITVIQSIYQY